MDGYASKNSGKTASEQLADAMRAVSQPAATVVILILLCQSDYTLDYSGRVRYLSFVGGNIYTARI